MTNEPKPKRNALEDFLATNQIDSGCARALELLDVYADRIAAGEDPEERFPDIAVHLAGCQPCAEDLKGLLAAIRGSERGV
jgi:hypothetical protein